MNRPGVPREGVSFSTGCGLGVVVGGPAAFGLVTLVGHAYAACDVGINASANGLGLLLIGLPVTWVLNAVVFGAILAGVSGRTWRRRALGVVAALAALVFLAWLLFAWQGTPADYPDPVCPSNVPPWWPSWIPV